MTKKTWRIIEKKIWLKSLGEFSELYCVYKRKAFLWWGWWDFVSVFNDLESAKFYIENEGDKVVFEK